MRMAVILVFGALLSACSSFYSVVPRSAIKTAGNMSIVSTALVMGSDKTLSDHIVSINSGKDCSTVRVEHGRTYCREDEPNPIPKVTCYRTLGDVMCYDKAQASSQPGDSIGNL